MSHAVEIVQEFFELGTDDSRFLEILDPEVVWLGTRGGLDEARVMHGPEAWVEYMQEIEEPWERFDAEVERLIAAPDDTVVVFLRETGRSRHGDLEVQNDTAMVFKVRRQKIVEARGYLDREEALRAAKLTD
jgi:ketosteroid isomerase-like protein